MTKKGVADEATEIVELSHVLVPGEGSRRFEVERISVKDVVDVVVPEGQWYIMHNIEMVNHIGTHVEVPYHCFQEGDDLASVPAERFLGEGVILDLRGCRSLEEIGQEKVVQAAEQVGGVVTGDIVFCNLGYARYYGTDEYAQAPYLSQDALSWLIAAGMKLFGVDAPNVDLGTNPEHINHFALFKNDIPLIENLTNLDEISGRRVKVSALPVRIRAVEAFPVRVVAWLYEGRDRSPQGGVHTWG